MRIKIKDSSKKYKNLESNNLDLVKYARALRHLSHEKSLKIAHSNFALSKKN